MKHTKKQAQTIVEYLQHKRNEFQSGLEYWTTQKTDFAKVNVIHFSGLINELDSR